ncbi:MAG: hypothetical protein IJ943_09825 [Akkermansia sp.]|nr:hypothetical protein [Akkermansia sp.]
MKKYLGLLTALVLSLFLLSCGEKESTSLERLYEAAANGNIEAQNQLFNYTGATAGHYQEMLADDMAYSDPAEAERWWKRAAQNGVTDGGPNIYILFWLRKYWLGVTLAIIAFFILRLRYGKRSDMSGGTVILIDTNVWMDDKLRPWFGHLERQVKKKGWIILLENIVLGELKGLSKNDAKRQIAQLGMSRIERLQNELGRQFRLENNGTAMDTIADTVLLRTAARHKGSILITNDRELRILARQQGIRALRSSECRF